MDFFLKIEELPAKIYVVLAVFMMAVHITVCAYTNVPEASVGLLLLAIYIIVSVIVHIVCKKKINAFRAEAEMTEKHNNGVVYTFQNNLLMPYAVVTKAGKIVTSNTAFSNIIDPEGSRSAFDLDIADICGISLEDIVKRSVTEPDIYSDAHIDFDSKDADKLKKDMLVSINSRSYRVECHYIYVKSERFYMILFYDVTEFLALDELHYAEHTAVTYIVLDNLDGLAQYAKESYEAEAAKVGSILKDWAAGLGGIIREHEKNKYIMICNRKNLNSSIATKFDVLDSVRQVLVGRDNIPITVSMGIATTGDTLAQREKEASMALDMAFQRGGDQVVLRNNMGTFYFGGKTKSMQKRAGGYAKVIAAKLTSAISAASNVVIMGHSNPDFDSIGACIGMAVLVRHFGKPSKIVMDTESDSFKACTGRLCELDDYKNIFTDEITALDFCDADTLVIIVDTNNFAILEAPEIAKKAYSIAIIDHHIKKEEYAEEPLICCIEPSASSASELVTEILEQAIDNNVLRSDEANILMAGIMVDTKNFTRTVGSRTFAAALFLKNAGASTEYARTFFDEEFGSYLSEAQFGTNAKIYRNSIVITSIEGTGTSGDRISAAKAADKLLTVRNIDAAFALVTNGSTVHVSARSNGSVNVQLILEKIGGGGHFDVAGAAISDSSIDDAEQLLKKAIDEYFKDTQKS